MENRPVDELWYWYLTGEKRATFPEDLERQFEARQRLFRLFPGTPRCFECNVPLAGLGGLILRPLGNRPSSFSPRFCNNCEKFARSREAGAEVVLSLLFADIRDSTPLAEKLGNARFKELIRRFYKVTSEVLIEHNAMVNRLMGDQISALFVPRFAGNEHARVAIQAAREILRVTGHEDPSGPWVPVGVGVHTGSAYVGVVGSKEGVNEIAVLGSSVNLTARLSSQAATGEILISEDAVRSAEFDAGVFQQRVLQLKGISTPVTASILQLRPGEIERKK